MTPSQPCAIVTGAGRGLGAAIAVRLAADGHPVVVNDVAGCTTADDVVRRIRGAGGTAAFVAADATSPDGVARLVEESVESYGSVGVLVPNATGPQPAQTVDDIAWPVVADHLDHFVKSSLLLIQAVLPGMRALGRGRIVNVGSDFADRVLPGMAGYSSAKAAQAALTRSLARELGPFAITVNLVAPGWIPVERHRDISAAERDAYVADVPLGRFGTPADVAGVVAFLVGDDAAFVTGQCIAVNGGHS